MSYTLSTTLVITRRSTAGTAPLWANAARPPTRSVPATANVPVATAPSFKNSRRFMALSLGWGLLAEERLRLAELGALGVGLLAERQELGVVRPGLGPIAREARGSRGAVEPPEAVRLHAHRRLELPQRLGRLVRFEEHLGQKLARRRERPRGHGVLLGRVLAVGGGPEENERLVPLPLGARHPDRKSTRLNSSHLVISYAVFCLKKKKNA